MWSCQWGSSQLSPSDPIEGIWGVNLFFETCPYPRNNKTCRTYIDHKTSLFCSYPPHFCIFPYIKNPRCSLSLPGCFEGEFKVPISMTGDGHGHSRQRNWSEFRSLPVSEGWWSGRKDFGSTENTFFECSCTKEHRNTVSIYGKTHVIYSIYFLYL